MKRYAKLPYGSVHVGTGLEASSLQFVTEKLSVVKEPSNRMLVYALP